MVLCGVIGIIKSFSSSYVMFLALEFLDAGLGSGTFMGAFILGMELVGPTKRTFGGSIILCFYSIGCIFLGTIAMLTENFRYLLRIVYGQALFIITYFWLIPESARWLMISGRKQEAVKVIMNAAQVNKVRFKERTLQNLHNYCNEISNSIKKSKSTENGLRSVLKSNALILRIVSCCFCWFVNAFVAYGLTLNSVDLDGSKYVNFILINLVDVPAYIITYFIMQHVGRRWSLSGTMLISGLACLGSLLIPTNCTADSCDSTSAMLRLTLFLIGKFAITASFGILYVYTTEIFPTNMRNSLMSTCSMIGRVGSMLAPQTPLLVNIFNYYYYIFVPNII